MFAELLRDRVGPIVQLSANQVRQLETHFELLTRWNRVLNLTSVRTVEEMVERHYAESLFLGAQLPHGELKIADIGSGAGFPGIPVAVLRPECSVTLIESHRRKSVFLREAIRCLKNVIVVATRALEVEGRFDWCISRAVKFEQIDSAAQKLANHIALLSVSEQPAASSFTWNKPLHLPWGQGRFLWIGQTSST